MSDRLEEFVRQNREHFDLHDPDPGIWLKINPTKVPLGVLTGKDSPDREKGRKTMKWLRIAAAVAMIFAGSTAGIYYLAGVRGDTAQYGEMYTEMQETQQYYIQRVAQRYSELRPYLDADPVADEMLKADFQELNQVYDELKEDLKDNAANPDVIEAMILNYRVKLEILDDLLNQLKEKENQDEKDDSHSL